MHSRGPKDQFTEQRICSISVEPATTNGLEPSQSRDTPPPAFSTCCPWDGGRRPKSLGKQVSSTDKPKPACEPQRGLGFYDGDPQSLLPPQTSHHRAAGGQSRKCRSCRLNAGAACALNRSACRSLAQPDQSETHLRYL